jgi:two-component system, OmpR family, response regulator
MTRPAEILVIEHQHKQLTMITAQLTHGGFATASFATGDAALEWLLDHRPDFVIIDLAFDDYLMNGLELCGEIRKAYQYDPFPIMLIAMGMNDVKLRNMAFKAGAEVIAAEALSEEQLLTIVTRYVDGIG